VLQVQRGACACLGCYLPVLPVQRGALASLGVHGGRAEGVLRLILCCGGCGALHLQQAVPPHMRTQVWFAVAGLRGCGAQPAMQPHASLPAPTSQAQLAAVGCIPPRWRCMRTGAHSNFPWGRVQSMCMKIRPHNATPMALCAHRTRDML